MKRIILFTFIFISSFSIFSQLYEGEKGWNTYFVEIKGDTLWVEVFLDSDQSFLLKEFDEKIVVNQPSGDTLADFPNLILIKKTKEYTILWKEEDKKKYKEIGLAQTNKDTRKELRQKVLMSEYRIELFNHLDSLSGPEKYIAVDINEAYLTLADKELPENEFLIASKKLKSELAKAIEDSTTTHVKNTYQLFSYLDQIPQEKINQLLAETNYNFFYSDALLLELAKKNPAALITYIDSEPDNKKEILKKIRTHENIHLITQNVSNVASNSEGKAQIILQEKKLNRKKKLKKIGSSTLIVGEVIMLGAVIIWFSKPR